MTGAAPFFCGQLFPPATMREEMEAGRYARPTVRIRGAMPGGRRGAPAEGETKPETFRQKGARKGRRYFLAGVAGRFDCGIRKERRGCG